MKTVPAKAGTVVSGACKTSTAARTQHEGSDMSAESKKRSAAEAALIYIPDNEVIGVGTGSTVNFFIDAPTLRRVPIRGDVSSSERSTALLKQHGIEVLDLSAVGDFDVYVDGADESEPQLHLIKGGRAALTRE